MSGSETTFVADGSADLSRRVADLEAALKKASDKEKADKAKAAGAMTAKVGGMLQIDGAMFNPNDGAKTQQGSDSYKNGVEFRRARIKVTGDGFDVIDYSVEMDFANIDSSYPTATTGHEYVRFKDTFIGVHDLPILGRVQGGYFKEPFGLEQLTSDRWTTFMERCLADEGAMVPGRDLGVMATNTYLDKRGTWAAGVFMANSSTDTGMYQDNNGDGAITMRTTFLPWYDEASGGRGLLHFGAAYSYRDNGTGSLKFETRPESHLAPRVLSQTITNVDHNQLFGGELAFIYGSFSFQAEYMGTTIDRTGANSDLTFSGGYACVSYFLTGEHRPYNRLNGTFDRIRPFTNFFRVRDGNGCVQSGWGAWEVAYRYSYLDLNSDRISGGNIFDNTLGVNWYLNPYTRLMFDYVDSNINRTVNGVNDGHVGIYEMRAAIDF